MPDVFDPTSSKFTAVGRPDAELLHETIAFAELWAHLAPVVRRSRHALGSWTVQLKAKYASDSPKYHSRLRPVSNHAHQPVAPLLRVAARALGYLVNAAAAAGTLPWVITRTDALVPALRRLERRAITWYAGVDTGATGIEWLQRQGDLEGFF